MNDKRILIDCLLRRKRIDFSPNKYFKRLKAYLFALISLAVLSSIYIVASNGLSYESFLLSFGVLAASLVIFSSLKKTKTASVKGDTLIMNNISNRSCVTSIRSIRKVQTRHFLGIYRTEITYYLDGLKRKAFFYNLASSVPVTPETSIKRAIKISHLNRKMAKAQIVQLEKSRARATAKEKQKANHKPDPVLFH